MQKDVPRARRELRHAYAVGFGEVGAPGGVRRRAQRAAVQRAEQEQRGGARQPGATVRGAIRFQD